MKAAVEAAVHDAVVNSRCSGRFAVDFLRGEERTVAGRNIASLRQMGPSIALTSTFQTVSSALQFGV